ncbi:nucleotide sugar dehydrogenase [Mycobacterium crocinum]|uniref:Nucleotide sugar dehydrogenase n=1 Tax=Mycolicibacterium crocinum TaxID=388459 RepID=A0ABY3TTA9_9MYCO|nr:nucleotide sugar dehydrogenase [Mycolicibacterium crocinum]MCV7215691.1 nucleotide sugar dehydrogenase [Mycolicibacterium crocinum]ULN42558.2 nucleotide sugar dehydrogenase [Mycolicibacterium crocinum]
MSNRSTVKVVVVGQGYVGLPLAIETATAGYVTTGLDLDLDVVASLSSGISHIDDISDDQIRAALARGYRASAEAAVLAQADIVVICVPTPLSADGSPDMAAVEKAVGETARLAKPGVLVILESTTYPGTTDNLVRPALEASGREIDRDFFLAFSPERIDPGNQHYTIRNTPKIVGGVTAESTRRASEFYGAFVDAVVPVKGAREAESAKLLENTYRHVNIALVNEMVRFCRELGIDLWEVIRAASTKPFGFQPFYPGPGVGGHCIPIDPNYLSYEVKRQLGRPFRFIELAQEINESMPRYVVDRLQDALNDAGKPVRGSRVLILGITYKPNIADQRQSPAKPIATLLARKGALLTFHDPLVDAWGVDGVAIPRVDDLLTAVSQSDAVLLLQAHRKYDVDDLTKRSQLFFDTRGASTHPAAVRL